MAGVTKAILWVSLLLIGCAASAEDQKAEWRWIHASSLGDEWKVYEGKVDAKIEKGTLRVQLCALKGTEAPCFEVAGAVKFDPPSTKSKDTRTGKVTALVTRLNSDMSPSTFSGSYWRSTSDNTDAENADPMPVTDKKIPRPLTHTEIITLSDGVGMVGLTRSWTEPK